ncbi:hypothetical protein GCM10023320_05710 [Pseudonocardia adelaidensis]|uniref:Uncharacterized protein n=1 Tax=Pseudonocardia adelaidensis TaxID=648754 RepID=A0ABP9NE02_9PSEU
MARPGCLAGLVLAVGVLVWAGISFSRHDPTPAFDPATTQEVVGAAAGCEPPGLPDPTPEQEQDRRAQIEQAARVDVATSGCLPAVDGGCDEPIISCRIRVGDEAITLRVEYGSCRDLITSRSCEYRLERTNRLLTQQRLHHEFAIFAEEQRAEGAVLRCDTIPGGADLFPLDDSPGLDPGYRSTPYRCYTREPKSVTDVYEVRLYQGGLPVFADERR